MGLTMREGNGAGLSRRSSTSTLAPRAASSSAKAAPRKPAPPGISTRCTGNVCDVSKGDKDKGSGVQASHLRRRRSFSSRYTRVPPAQALEERGREVSHGGGRLSGQCRPHKPPQLRLANLLLTWMQLAASAPWRRPKRAGRR